MTKLTASEFKEILNDLYAQDQDIAEAKKQLKEDLNNYADQVQVDHKAMAAAFNAYKKILKKKDTDYLATAEAAELIELVESMFGPEMDDEE